MLENPSNLSRNISSWPEHNAPLIQVHLRDSVIMAAPIANAIPELDPDLFEEWFALNANVLVSPITLRYSQPAVLLTNYYRLSN